MKINRTFDQVDCENNELSQPETLFSKWYFNIILDFLSLSLKCKIKQIFLSLVFFLEVTSTFFNCITMFGHLGAVQHVGNTFQVKLQATCYLLRQRADEQHYEDSVCLCDVLRTKTAPWLLMFPFSFSLPVKCCLSSAAQRSARPPAQLVQLHKESSGTVKFTCNMR